MKTFEIKIIVIIHFYDFHRMFLYSYDFFCIAQYIYIYRMYNSNVNNANVFYYATTISVDF